MNKSTFPLLSLFVLTLLALAACGGPQDAPVETAATAPIAAATVAEPVATATTPAETAVPAAEPEPLSSFQTIEPAIIQIEAQGSFIDPAEGLQLNSAGRGSGFIISPDGTAVTNNHVVTGAAFLQVWVGGESEPRSARILGVSECSDLAVIDIEGDGFPYLAWYEEDPAVGLEIYVAGFPLGDPEYTLTRGIISKREADGETPWSSVAQVLEYDAVTNPGNSGGAVVDENGRVVAVHYASYPEARQAFGIGADAARDIISDLQEGRDQLAIGINGSAITDGDLAGIWVASVESGSPADEAGIRPGDIITKMEGLVLATDGTLADYCRILESHSPGDVLGIEVLRYDTEEVLEGQINGRALEPAFSFAQEIAPENLEPETGSDADDTTYTGITDDTGAIVVQVPDSWADVDGSLWQEDGEILGASLAAGPDLDAFNSTYESPGLVLLASNTLGGANLEELLDNFSFAEDCIFDSRSPYEDPLYTGVFDLYTDCGGLDTILLVLAAEPEEQGYGVVLIGQGLTSSDVAALDQALNTFNIVGDLP